MKRIVTFEEVMLRLSPSGSVKFSQATSLNFAYGGGEANVAPIQWMNSDLHLSNYSEICPNELP